MPVANFADQSDYYISDTYASRLYAACEGFPLWNPSVCNLGDIGYIRQGTFHTLYNAEHGPAADRRPFSATVQMARRTSVVDAPDSSAGSSDTNITATTTSTGGGGGGAGALVTTETGSPSPPPQQSDIVSSRRVSLSRLFLPHTSNTGGSTFVDHQPPPPLPLHVEREEPRVFEMGPRMSNNYKSLGFSVGADLSTVAGVPLGATISFEAAGGTGAILLAKDPIYRHLLRHRGVLKAYFLAHHDYIQRTYGEAEDVDVDEMAFIYGQDCTSDWACAVILEAERGSKVEFTVFSIGQAGVWGDWKTACSASQRGPYRGGTFATTHREPNQTIVIKRLTIQLRRFRPVRMKASAEPKPDDWDEKRDHRRRPRNSNEKRHDDPLQMIHDYIFEHSSARYSLASDDDALTLIKMVGQYHSYDELKVKVWTAARNSTSITVDAQGVASLAFHSKKQQQQKTTEQSNDKPTIHRHPSSHEVKAY